MACPSRRRREEQPPGFPPSASRDDRYGLPGDRQEATYVLGMDYADWQALHDGYDPQRTVMYRKMLVEQGNILEFFKEIYFFTECLAVIYPDTYETDEAVWLPAGEVDRLELHPGFAAAWPVLREALLPLTAFADGTGPDWLLGPLQPG